MKPKTILLLVSAVALLLLLGVAALYVRDDSTHYKYESYTDIAKDPSVKAASVPAVLPASAAGIVGWYNVEFNEEGVEFTFDPKDTAAMVAKFDEARSGDAESVKRVLDRYSWEKFDSGAKLSLYLRKNQAQRMEYLAIDPARSRAYYIAKHE